ncbi:MAG: HAD family phosphatase [Formivibrio sp.]|nr:HAD family phosphatase [Formivibrio sp.]
MPIRAVVFDLGGVLVDWNPEYVYRELIPDQEQRQWFLEHVCNSTWNVQQDAGRSLAEGTTELLEKHPEHAMWIRAFYGRWTEMLAGELPEGIALLETLQDAGLPLYALTNWSAETFPYARKNLPFLQLFRDILVSGELGLIKPNPAIYHKMQQRIAVDLPGIAPEEIAFIDDAAHNIRAACNLGWQGVHHIDIHATRAALRQHGLPV